MIYLIDDKKTRQKDFGWTEEKLAQYDSYLKPLYNIGDVANIGENLYSNGNIILYHESFLDFTGDRDKAVEQRNKLKEQATAINSFSIAFFSGSQSFRSLHKNVAHLPVAILYQNLETLIQHYSQQNGHLKHLLFGENPGIEENLNELLTQANRNIEEGAIELLGNTIFMHPDEDFIPNAIFGGTTEEIYHAEDEALHEIVKESLSRIEYDNIFLPLCFGPTLSDYNGLRLATHIRCTPTKNQLKRIFIYGFVGLEYLIDHEYFNILKTKNVELVLYSKKAFKEAAKKSFEPLEPEELSKEIQKLKLDPPSNYADSHSIANEWAIYRWSKALQLETESIQRIEASIGSNLYYKFLKCKSPITEVETEERILLNSGSIFYIDDELKKGWDAIFKKICSNKNYESIDFNFKEKTSCEIVSFAISEIKRINPDTVVLDYRLHNDDFTTRNPQEITGYKILKKIKEFNEGIQVIVLSATNKIWSLLELQKAGADGFILKESPELSVIDGFSKTTIGNTYKIIDEALDKKYLKEIYLSWNESIQATGNSDETFITETKVALNTAWQLVKSEHLDMGYLTLFQIIESYANELYQSGDGVDNDLIGGVEVIDKSNKDKNIWKLEFKEDNKGDYFSTSTSEQEKTQRPTTLFKVSCLFHFKYDSKNEDLQKIGKLNKLRNNIAHGKKVPKNKKQHSTKDDIKKLLELIKTIRSDKK